MKRIKNSLVACAGLALVIALVALATPTKTQGQGGNQQPLNVRVIEQPLTVRVIETPRQAFHHHFELVFGTDLLAAETFTVPAGKQLVLTYASADVRRVGVNVSFAIQVLGGTGVVLATHHLVPAAAGPLTTSVSGPQEAIVASEPLHLYVDAGQTVVGRAIRDDSGGLLNGDIDVSGYLVDVPQ